MGNEQAKKQSNNTYHPDIIVVSDKTDLSSAETSRFQYIPLFYPILKSSIGLKDDNLQVEINSSEIINLCNRLQTHMNMCADTVTADQNSLSNRIKEIDFVGNTLLNGFVDRQKKYAKYCVDFGSVKDISNNLRKIQRNVDELMVKINEINSLLPEQERLESLNLQEV